MFKGHPKQLSFYNDDNKTLVVLHRHSRSIAFDNKMLHADVHQ